MKTGGKSLRSFPALGSSGSQGGLLESWLGMCRWGLHNGVAGAGDKRGQKT